MSISTIITAAGKNSRMRNDQISRNIELTNKLILPFKNKTVIETTIDNALSADIDECIVVLGHYANEILESIFDNYKDSVKFVINNPVDVGLSVSLYNGLSNISSDFALCITADQPTVSTETFNRMIEASQNSKNPNRTISILRRRKIGLLDSAEGLGMPFVAHRLNLMNYLENEDDNINPILRKIFNDGYTFYGIKEKNKKELLNINYYDDYLALLD
ncbi:MULTISPECIES: NTP transferase domain-containing protein [Methanobrevibacter]|uniref:Molybdenum cofactor cytidylyltransferase n=1 Tax=Methanobrevibacter gottschalkii DSM 11977 TaxID=1122229 RepID=A0A3N5C1Q3_9EURY|nr:MULTISPECIES: NTP transferase domain-containing protein [Methanobrevibacter]OEC98734.1 molybdopterin-guanine dinucleotide biosynthesis protein MobA [Methanobrevibacter sp. A27]RPF51925.1 molybdenum cofactor cytidylyltransferase [Methanobrevibacter gottschalkii DSM 11977]